MRSSSGCCPRLGKPLGFQPVVACVSKIICLRYSKTSCEATPKNIHGPHGEHGKEILVKISSISDAIQNKTLPKSEELERILVKDFR